MLTSIRRLLRRLTTALRHHPDDRSVAEGAMPAGPAAEGVAWNHLTATLRANRHTEDPADHP